MRILHLLSQTHLTGAEAHAVTLAEGLLRDGHAVFIVSDRLHLKTGAVFFPRPIHAAKGWRRCREILWLRAFLKRERIDVVHAHSRAGVRIAWWATRGLSTALVSTVHGHQHFSLGKRLFDLYGERVIAICRNLKTHLVRDFRMRDSRIKIIGNPVQFQHPPALHTDPRRWLLVTRWTGPKGRRALELLQDLMPDLLTQNPGLVLDICGQVPDSGSRADKTLKDLAARFPDRFHMRGLVDPVENEIPRYGLVLGGGRVAIAAVGMGVPCFAFGEVETIGLVREEGLERARASNFGDIIPGVKDCKLGQELTLRTLKDFLEGVGRPSAEERLRMAAAIRADFDHLLLARRLLGIYQSARLMKAHPAPIPVLMYHMITQQAVETPHRIFVTAERFRRHLRALRWGGRTPLRFSDLKDFKEGRRPLSEFPRRPVLLTFDDGYENNLSLALPLLREFGMTATIFLLADASLTANDWDAGQSPQIPLMTPAQRKTLADSGLFEIGSHGFRHERLPAMTDEQARTELRESRQSLEKEFGRPIHAFAFTYGDIDARAAQLAREAGYDYAVNTDQGAIHIEENPWSVFRVNVFPEDGPLDVLKKTRGAYRWRYFRRRGR